MQNPESRLGKEQPAVCASVPAWLSCGWVTECCSGRAWAGRAGPCCVGLVDVNVENPAGGTGQPWCLVLGSQGAAGSSPGRSSWAGGELSSGDRSVCARGVALLGALWSLSQGSDLWVVTGFTPVGV